MKKTNNIVVIPVIPKINEYDILLWYGKIVSVKIDIFRMSYYNEKVFSFWLFTQIERRLVVQCHLQLARDISSKVMLFIISYKKNSKLIIFHLKVDFYR